MTTSAGAALARFTPRDRRALFLMSLVGLVVGYGAAMISSTIPFVRTALDLSEGGMFGVLAVTRALSLLGVAFAFAADREGRREPFLAAFALIPVGNLLTGLFPNPIIFTLTQSVTRIGVVAVAALSIVYLAEQLTPGRRAFGIGVYGVSGAMGGGLALLVLPFADTGDERWRLLFGFTALGVLVLPMLNRFLSESRAFVRTNTRVGYQAVMSSESAGYFWVLAGAAFLIAAFSGPAFDFVLERLITGLEWETRDAAMMLIVFSGLGTVGLLVGGRIADVVGRRATMAVAIVIGLIGGVGFYFATTGVLIAASVFLGTLGATMLTPAFAATRTELFPTRLRATASGLITNTAIIGALLGFGVGRFIVDRIGLSQTILLLSVGLLVALWLVLQLPETKGKDLVGYTVGR